MKASSIYRDIIYGKRVFRAINLTKGLKSYKVAFWLFEGDAI